MHKYPAFIEWFSGLPAYISNQKPIKIISLVLMVAAVLAYYPTRYDDYDIWWHIALGKYYIQNHTMRVDHSIFSWTPADPGWIYNTWLGSTLLYIAYSLASGFGLWLVQWFILLSIFFLIFYYVKLAGDSFDINYISGILLLAVALNLTAIYYKPENFTALIFTIVVFIYFYSKLDAERARLFYLYPPLFILWVNLHGGFLAGLLFISIALFGELANYFLIKKGAMQREKIISLAVSVPLSYLATLINPYGINYHLSVLEGMFSQAYMGYATRVFAYKKMWSFVFPTEFAFRFINTAWVILIFAAIFIVINIYAYKRQRFFDATIILLNLVFFYFGMETARYTIFFPIVFLFSSIYILKRADLFHLKIKFSFVSLLLFLYFTGYVIYTAVLYLDVRIWFGNKIEEGVPVNEVEFIKKHKIPGPLFNDYLIGGYMIWAMYPEYKVFIDPRYGPFWKDVGPDYFDFYGGATLETLKKFTEKYPFKAALIHMRDSNMIIFLVNSGEWKLLYFDKVAAVLVHKSIVPTLSDEALATDMSPSKYKDLSDPGALLNLFSFYVSIGPQYGWEILQYFKKNVTDLFISKAGIIQDMENRIRQREAEVRQKMLQQGGTAPVKKN